MPPRLDLQWTKPALRNLHDPIRSLDEALGEISCSLWAELSASQTSSQRRAAIFRRLELVISVGGQMAPQTLHSGGRGVGDFTRMDRANFPMRWDEIHSLLGSPLGRQGGNG